MAVLDSGVEAAHPDLKANLIAVTVSSGASTDDEHGHGTHVIGIIKGQHPNGNYLGVAPDARVVSVRIADNTGMAREADLLRGLQWAFDNRAPYSIRVVNVSMSAAIAASYKNSPVAAAVEQLWFNGVVVVAAAGNRGSAADATWYAPGNDPYVITVGALYHNQTADAKDRANAS